MGSASFKRSSLRLHLKPYDVFTSLTSVYTTRRHLPPTPSSPQRPLPSNNHDNPSQEPKSHFLKRNQEYPLFKRHLSQLKSITTSSSNKNKVIFADFINNLDNRRRSSRAIYSSNDIKNLEGKTSIKFEVEDPLVFWTTKETTS